ncbi:hypothetical protein LINPERPRIM_LOCUS41203 [Linum perenne]
MQWWESGRGSWFMGANGWCRCKTKHCYS